MHNHNLDVTLTPSSGTLRRPSVFPESPSTSRSDSLVRKPRRGRGGLTRSISLIVWLGGDMRTCPTVICWFGLMMGAS